MKINPKQLAAFLGLGVLVLIILHILACIPMILIEERAYPLGMFSLDGEANIPTMYATVLLWFNALLFLCVAWAVPQGTYGKIHWGGLSLLFLFAGLDESVEIHERCMEAIRGVVETSGIFHFAWVIPYGLAGIALGLIYLRFYLRLPTDIRRLFFGAGLLLVGGAVGVEMLSGLIVESCGKGLLYYGGVIVEEGAEMAGSIVLIYALLRYIELYVPGFRLSISSANRE